jgi:molybdopterin converting factor small subunit
MALLDIIINTLKINCSVVQCTGYASDIEALFYLFFFPTVFIILFIYIVIGVVLDKAGGKEGGLRLLVSVALYAFIVFQGYYNLFVSLSRLWWVLLATLVGLWIFIRTLIKGRGGDKGGSPFPAVRGSGGVFDYAGKKVRGKLEGTAKKKITQIEQELSNLRSEVNTIEGQFENPSQGTDIGNLIDKYKAHKKFVLETLEEYSNLGKASMGGINWDIEKKDEEYMKELKELDDRVEKISEKLYKKAE